MLLYPYDYDKAVSKNSYDLKREQRNPDRINDSGCIYCFRRIIIQNIFIVIVRPGRLFGIY